jgi:hypothetical protein
MIPGQPSLTAHTGAPRPQKAPLLELFAYGMDIAFAFPTLLTIDFRWHAMNVAFAIMEVIYTPNVPNLLIACEVDDFLAMLVSLWASQAMTRQVQLWHQPSATCTLC